MSLVSLRLCSDLHLLFMQESVEIRTEDGLRVKLSPDLRYSEDFEPYESVNMEVDGRFPVTASCFI